MNPLVTYFSAGGIAAMGQLNERDLTAWVSGLKL